MKKILPCLLAITMLVCFVGCGNETEVTLGTVNGNIYESTFIGIGCALPDGFTFYSQEQIAQNNSAAYDMLSEDIAEELQSADVIYDMAAADESGSSVNVNIENLGLLGVAVKNADEYVDIAVSQAAAPLEELGFTDVDAFKNTITFAGEKHPAVQIVATQSGFTCYQTSVCIMVDNHMASISVGSLDKATHDALLASFYALTPPETTV